MASERVPRFVATLALPWARRRTAEVPPSGGQQADHVGQGQFRLRERPFACSDPPLWQWGCRDPPAHRGVLPL